MKNNIKGKKMKKEIILLILLLCGTAKGGWISPISTTDVDHPFAPTFWDNMDNSIDGDICTYTEESEITLFHREIQFNFETPYPEVRGVRIKAADAYYNGIECVTEIDAEVEIDFQLDGGNWYNFYDGFLATDRWNIITPYTAYPISALRIQSMNENYKLRIYEVQIKTAPEPATIMLLGLGSMMLLKRRKF